MKSTKTTLTLVIGALLVSSCSIVKGLRTDGKNGPNIFSYEKQEHDTITIGDTIFQYVETD